MSGRLQRWLVASILVVQACLLVYSAKIHSPTWDEVGHLAAGVSHWELGRFELYSVNPPLVRTVAAAPVVFFGQPKMDWGYYRSDPALRSEVFLGRRMMELNGPAVSSYFFWARLALLPVALLGTLLCAWWARELFGGSSALVAACLWAFSPSSLAYGSLITPDLSAAVALIGCSIVFWKWLQRPNWTLALGLAAACAIAMLTKSIWLLLPPLFILTWGLHLLMLRRHGAPSKVEQSPPTAYRAGGQLVLSGALATVLVAAFYGFADIGKPLGEFIFVSQSFAGPADCEGCGVQVGNRFARSWLGSLPVPLPANYLQGIDVQRRDFERGLTDPSWRSYWKGTWQQGGWWYFYLAGIFLKEPLLLWLMCAVATIYFFARGSEFVSRSGLACLCIPVVALLVLLSVNTGLNLHVRYALPVLPVVVIWTAQLGRLATTDRRWASRLVAVACTGFIAISLWHGPHWLSYFNVGAGGPAGGHRYLCDSNVDWGQDLGLLNAWLDKHPEAAKDLQLAYFGSYDPRALGIKYHLPSPLFANAADRTQMDQLWMGPHPGWYVISKNYVVGHSMPVPDGINSMQFKFFAEPVYSYFADFKPIDRIGHSMLVYKLEPEAVDRYRLARGMVPLVLDHTMPEKQLTSAAQQVTRK